jgi:hypothetical protein
MLLRFFEIFSPLQGDRRYGQSVGAHCMGGIGYRKTLSSQLKNCHYVYEDEVK